MHPIERLRYVARASGVDPNLLVREAAAALASVVRVEPVGALPACRRLIDRHLTTGPIWWLSARVLSASDPAAAAWAAASEIEDDPTEALVVSELPADVTVTVVGWPDIAAGALRRRGDVELLVAESGGEGDALARRLSDADVSAISVPDGGIAAAVVVSDLVLIEAHAGGPSGILAPLGSHAASAVAASAGIPVWAVTGVGRILPSRLWEALLRRVDERGDEPWDRPVELVPVPLISETIGPGARRPGPEGLAQAGCPAAAELLRNAR